MKPLFTIHEGEFLVGDHINRKFGTRFYADLEVAGDDEREEVVVGWPLAAIKCTCPSVFWRLAPSIGPLTKYLIGI